MQISKVFKTKWIQEKGVEVLKYQTHDIVGYVSPEIAYDTSLVGLILISISPQPKSSFIIETWFLYKIVRLSFLSIIYFHENAKLLLKLLNYCKII